MKFFFIIFLFSSNLLLYGQTIDLSEVVISRDYNFGFEKVSNRQRLPDGWVSQAQLNPALSYHKYSIDSITKHSGNYALLIESTDSTTERHYGMVRYLIPARYQGKKIQVRAFMKAADKSQTIGVLQFWTHDGYTAIREGREISQHKISTQWKRYSTKTQPLSHDARFIVLFIGLRGHGKIWLDDIEILIDGKDISKAKLKEDDGKPYTISDIRINILEKSIKPGESFTIKAYVVPVMAIDKDVIWRVDDMNNFSINDTGLTCIVTASADAKPGTQTYVRVFPENVKLENTPICHVTVIE